MRVLLRKTATLEYFGGAGVWVKDRSLAFDFQSTLQALDFCLQSGLSGAEIVMAWGNSALDIVFPCEPRLEVLLPQMARNRSLEEHA
jgi:hypothetical protein